MQRMVAIPSLFLFLICSTLAASESTDWPCWRGPNGDGKSLVKDIKKDWSNGLTKLWEVDNLCQGEGDTSTWSAPSIKGDKLVVPGKKGDNDVIFCLNAETGELIWKKEYPTVQTERQGGTRYGTGSRATPCIEGNKVYTFGGWGDLVCWGLADGKELWRRNVADDGGIPANFGYTSSPLVYDDKVIILAGGTAMVVAYNKETGEPIWKRVWEGGSGKPGYASPIAATINGRDQILMSAPAGGDDRDRHSPGRVAGLNPESGEVIWESPWWCMWDMFATPVIDGSIAVVGTGKRSGSMALKIEGSSATQIWENWRNDILAPTYSDPVIVDGYIYGYSGHSSDYYEEDRPGRELQCVDLMTGELKWRGGADASWGTLVYVDGLLLCLTDKGKLLLVNPDPNEYNKITEFQTSLRVVDSGYPKKSQYVWTIPVVANGKLYVRYCNHLICYDLTN